MAAKATATNYHDFVKNYLQEYISKLDFQTIR